MRGILLLLVFFSAVLAETYLYVDVVPHSHDDVGWVQTIDEYYEKQVRSIYDTTVESLVNDPKLTFVYVEQAFFSRWWEDSRTSDKQRNDFRTILSRKQAEFVIGGWVMHDEATVTYSAAIDQVTEGHQYIVELFGKEYNPNVGWQIDPFGASATTPVLNNMFNFTSHVIARIPWQDMDEMKASQSMEFNWIGSRNTKSNTKLFTHCLWESYCQPGATFDYDTRDISLPSDADQLVSYIRERSKAYKSDHVLIPWGCDFRWTNASHVFENLNILIDYINTRSNEYNMELSYQKLSDYFSVVVNSHEQDPDYFPTLEYDDFFPYTEREASYWTGYFTSHPQLKALTRSSEAFLKSSDAIYTIVRENKDYDFTPISTLRRAIAETQHHDGVTGTEKEYVAEMYTDDLNNGISQTETLDSQTLSDLVSISQSNKASLSVSNSGSPINIPADQTTVIVLYNSLGWRRREVMSISITNPSYKIIVTDSNQNVIQSQVTPSYFSDGQKSDLWIFVDLPALGYNTYYITLDTSTIFKTPQFSRISSDLVLSNDFLEVFISNSTGRMSYLKNLKSNIEMKVDHQVLRYSSGYYLGQASGAYVFLPQGEASPISNDVVETLILVDDKGNPYGDLVNLIYQKWETGTVDYMENIFVFFNSDEELVSNYIISANKIGVIPQGAELITRYSTSLVTGTRFYTDSEGYEMQPRDWKHSSFKYTSNYYPSVYTSYIEDPQDNSRFTLVFDSSHGVSSQGNGTIEYMTHRRCLMDDSKGVEEVLDDTTVIYPQTYLNFETSDRASYFRHQLEYRLNFPPLVGVGSSSSIDSWNSKAKPYYTTMKQELPANIHLLSFKALTGNTYSNILRLTHVFEVDEDSHYSQPVTIDVKSLFSDLSVSSCVETTLSANNVKDSENNCVVTLQPKEIKTFLIEFN